MDVMETIRATRVIAVVRARAVPDPEGLVAAIGEAGIRCVEFTLTTDGALDALRAVSGGEVVCGVGTVRSAKQGAAAVDAGAQFVVTPIVSEDVVAVVPSGIPVIVGAFSPTEIDRALRSGAQAVKLFPARVGGADYVADLLGPLPEVDLIPSGGVDADNAGAFIAAGAVAVFAGSSVAPPPAVEAGDLKASASGRLGSRRGSDLEPRQLG